MNERVIKAIDALVAIIYTPDQYRLASAFQELVEALIAFVEELEKMGYTVDLTKELLVIQDAFEKKDYVMLADALLYDLKPQFEDLAL
ncbi:MAG: hypothetical protein PWP24_322 [Clostridiales bacterium]|nr:hypothetical protein [Clostridiales bacterium]